MDIQASKENIRGLDETAMHAAAERQNTLLKPAGSLGVLEDISIRIAGITGSVCNTIDKRVHYLFGADNGVYAEGVAAAPQEFTRILMTNYAGGNCGINVLCSKNNVDLRLIDMGIIGAVDNTLIADHKLMSGTNNIAKQPAMTNETALAAMQIGFDCACEAKREGYEIIGTGEVGMANTTTAAACIMATLDSRDAELAVGRGAGLTDEMFIQKKLTVLKALERNKPDPNDTVDIISKVGGLDIAALTGLYIGAAFYRVPIVVDGVISVAAALLAKRFAPLTVEFMFASHLSEEPAYILAVSELGLMPLLNLNMRLGEGSGCPIAMMVIDTALTVMRDMNTFDQLKLPTDYQKDIKA